MKQETYIWDKGYARPTEMDRIGVFVCYCIESVAKSLGCSSEDVYKRMKRVNLI